MSHWLIVAATFAALLHGSFTYYARGVMQQVYANQLAYGHVAPCPRCVGMIALVDRQYLGHHAYITFPGGKVHGPYLVTDAAQLAHVANFEARGIIGEVSYETAQALGMAGPLADVTVFVLEGRE